MTKTEHRALDNLLKTLRSRGVDVDARAELARDFVQLATRIAKLRRDEKREPAGVPKRQMQRAIAAAAVERRRLHDRLYQGARRPVRAAPAAVEETDADRAWRAYLWRGVGDAARIEAAHGEPSWSALLYRDLAEEREAERAIRHNRRWRRDDVDAAAA